MIKNITIQNLCNVDNLKIDFDNETVTMLVGGSGCGKTTIVGAVFACLYGSFPDKPDISLYNDAFDPEKPSFLSLDVEIGDDTFHIERTIDNAEKRSLTYVYNQKDSINPIVGPQQKGFNSWVEHNIMDKDLFLSVSYLSQSGKGDICELSPAYASDSLIRLFGLKGITDISKDFQSLAKQKNGEVASFDFKIKEVRDAKQELEEVKILTKAKNKTLEASRKIVDGLETKIASMSTSETASIIKELFSKLENQKSEVKRLEVSNDASRKKKAMFEDQIKKVDSAACKKGDKFEYPKCPLLNVTSLGISVESIAKEIDTNLKKMAKLSKDIKATEGEIETLKNTDEFSLSIEKEGIIRERQTEQDKASSLIFDLGSFSQREKVLTETISKEDEIKQEMEKVTKQSTYCDFIHRAFARDGAPSMIIDAALPEINKIANDICKEFALPFAFEVSFLYEQKTGEAKEALNITLKDPNDRNRHVTSFSGGEKQMARLVFRFALQSYLKNNLNKNFLNIFIGDEIWSAMDASLRKSAIDIIKSNKAFDQVLVVSHMFDVMNDFSNVYEVYKENETSPTMIKEVK